MRLMPVIGYLLFFFGLPVISYCQCAPNYVGIYGVRHCETSDTITNYTFNTEIIQSSPSQIIIRNFHGIPNGVLISADEDTIVANLNCSNDSLLLDYVWHAVSGGGLSYNGEGAYYTDSIVINYNQTNPSGSQNICLVYRQDY